MVECHLGTSNTIDGLLLSEQLVLNLTPLVMVDTSSKPKFQGKVIKDEVSSCSTRLATSGMCLGEMSEMINYNQYVFISTLGLIKMQKINRLQFEGLCRFNIGKGGLDVTVRLLLFKAHTSFCYIVLYIKSHIRPEETIMEKGHRAVKALVPQVIVQFFQHS